MTMMMRKVVGPRGNMLEYFSGHTTWSFFVSFFLALMGRSWREYFKLFSSSIFLPFFLSFFLLPS